MRAFVSVSYECDSLEHAQELSKGIAGPEGSLYTIDVINEVTPEPVKDSLRSTGFAMSHALFPGKGKISLDENAGIPTGTDGPVQSMSP